MRVARFVSVALTLMCAAIARGQTVRGIVVDATDRPVNGVVVTLVDSTAAIAARALTNDRGEFRLAATRAGTYRLRTLRIGFRPVLSDPVALLSGGEISQRIALTSVALRLDTVRVAGENVCRAFSDSGAATYAVWEQIRTALTAAELTAGARTILATTVAYDRDLDPRGGRNAKPLRQSATVSTNYVTRAWRTLAPDSLHRAGYVVVSKDNSTTYYLPGLDMLLSPIFVADHCFKLVDDRRQSRLGITFEPIPERRHGPAEIRGTLWVDGATSELRQLEFRYVNLQSGQEDQAGGAVEFARMRDGAWAVSRWEVRMPIVEQVVIPGHGAEARVTGLHVNGGQLALARRGSDTLWAAPSLDSTLTAHRSAATLIDSTTSLKLEVPNARQPAAGGATFTGVVVSDSTHAPIVGAEVAFPDLAKSTLTDERGRFRVVGIPAGEQHLVIRRLGFGAADTRVTFTGHDTVERRVVLGAAIVLNPVTVSERTTDRTMPGFEENRRAGLGHFLVRADLEKYTGMKLATAMQQVQGWGMNEGRGHNYPSSRLAPSCAAAASVRGENAPQPPGHCYVPSRSEIQAGIRASCYAQVYVDGVLMNGSREPTEPFDVATIAPEEVEAIEYYASAAQTPLKYSNMASACGVLVIWMRR